MEIWTLIVKSNTFNFLILLGLIIFAIKFFKVGNLIESACTKVRETVEKSQNAKEDSKNELQKANEAVKNIAREVEEIFNNAQKSAELMGKKFSMMLISRHGEFLTMHRKPLSRKAKKQPLRLPRKPLWHLMKLQKIIFAKPLKKSPIITKILLNKA